jgi:hypothetical protein
MARRTGESRNEEAEIKICSSRNIFCCQIRGVSALKKIP